MKLDRYGQIVALRLPSNPDAEKRLVPFIHREGDILWAGKPDLKNIRTTAAIVYTVFLADRKSVV